MPRLIVDSFNLKLGAAHVVPTARRGRTPVLPHSSFLLNTSSVSDLSEDASGERHGENIDTQALRTQSTTAICPDFPSSDRDGSPNAAKSDTRTEGMETDKRIQKVEVA
jgi:hypothetical protein